MVKQGKRQHLAYSYSNNNFTIFFWEGSAWPAASFSFLSQPSLKI